MLFVSPLDCPMLMTPSDFCKDYACIKPSACRKSQTRLYWMNIALCESRRHKPLIVIIIHPFPHLWLIAGFVTRTIRQVPRVEQELPSLPDHLCSSGGVRIVRSVFFCLMFCLSLFVLLSLFYWPLHIVCSSSTYSYLLPLWFHQTFLKEDSQNDN